MSDEEALRCPYCGAAADVIQYDGFWVQCLAEDCKMSCPVRLSEADAIATARNIRRIHNEVS